MGYKGIIIFGPMGAGKDVLADYLVEMIPGSAIYKLGGDIRKTVDRLANYIPEVLKDKRGYYQKYGQTQRTSIHEDYWNVLCLDRIEFDRGLSQTVDLFPIIADGRQLNELSFWEKQGFLSLGIHTIEPIRFARLLKRDRFIPPSDAFIHDTELQATYIATNRLMLRFENDGQFDKVRNFASMVVDTVL